MPKNDSQANIIECLYYNEDEWVKDGELIVNTESTSTCEIHHLSIFSIGRFVNENPTITESEEFEYYKLTGIFILITIVIFFGAISFW